MGKKLLIIGGSAVGLVIVALVIASFYVGEIVAKGINSYGPDMLQTNVHVSNASISPFSGEGTVRGFVVGNPKGWSDANLGALSKIHIAVVPKSVFGDHIIIKDIDIEGPEFNYETKLVSSNVGDLMSNVERAAGGGGGSKPAVTKNGKPIKIEVQHFRVRDGTVRLGAGSAGLKLPLPPIELSDIGTKQGGVTPDQMTATVMRSITNGILKATADAAGKIGSTAGAAAATGVKSAGSAIKGLFKKK